ncbi:MAG: hypothetical protein L3J23_00150 [Flavobacteriaceae bacterium]|nr:hypothetical protein [Flavobacteriaceae bacterium]
MKKNNLKLILVFVTLLVTNIIIAQTSPSRVPPPPPGVPLDGGLITLFIIAFGIAVKKLGFKK